MSERVHVLATLRARAGREAEFGALLEGLLEPTRAEEGCIRYDLWRNQADPAEFTFVEEWSSAAALEQHFLTEHIQRVRADSADLQDGTTELRRYRAVR